MQKRIMEEVKKDLFNVYLMYRLLMMSIPSDSFFKICNHGHSCQQIIYASILLVTNQSYSF